MLITLSVLSHCIPHAFEGTLCMASASASSQDTPIIVHFARVYLEYDSHYEVRGDRLAAEVESSKPFPGVVIQGSVVSHIDKGLGITNPRIHCNLDSGMTSMLKVMVHPLSPH